MNIHGLTLGFMVMTMMGVLGGPAAADTDPLNPTLNDKYGIWIGGFFPKVDSEIQINGEIIGDGPILGLEDTLGLEDSKSVLWGGASWRISQRNNLEIEFNNLNRSGSTTVVTDDIIIGDSIAKVGATVDTTFDLAIGRLTYGYSMVRTEKMDVQIKAGLHLTDVAASIQLSGAVEVCQPGETPPDCSDLAGSTDRLESSDVTLPLPHLGLSFAYAFTPKLAVRTQILGFALEVSGIRGSLVEVDADLVYNPWERFGLGAGLRYFNANVKSTGSRLNGEFDFQYLGPVVYGKLTF